MDPAVVVMGIWVGLLVWGLATGAAYEARNRIAPWLATLPIWGLFVFYLAWMLFTEWLP